MVVINARTLANVVKGKIAAGQPGAMAASAAIDTREVTSGSAFFALPGEHVDGHSFVGKALSRGARIAVVSRADDEVLRAFEANGGRDSALVVVRDTAAALTALAAYNRSKLSCPVVGVTGSSGKTTTKDYLRSVLQTRLAVVATEGNRNNELGVPLTLLRADRDCGAVVVEMAMRGAGQISDLCEVAKPDLGLVTNVGTSHIELLGSQEAIAGAKGELVAHLPESGRAFLNVDDEWSERLAVDCAAPVTWYGLDEKADVRAVDLKTDAAGCLAFTLHTTAGDVDVSLGIPGRHNAYNAAAAAAVGLHLGLNLREIAKGLASACMAPMRMEVFETASGVTIVNDAYNANPASMKAAIATLRDIDTNGRRVAVLGDMAELGMMAELAHFKVGEDLGRGGVDVLVTVGARAARIGDGARATGMSADAVHGTDDADEALQAVRALLAPGDVVLVKASRIMGLETIVEGVTST